jgi:two-component system sensor histidine kinase RstB
VARVRLRLEMLNPEPGPQRDRADGIRRDLDELESLIDAAITYSQLDDAGARLRQEPLDLGSELRRLLQDQSLLAPGIAVELRMPEGASRLSADRGLLRRALQNLLGNALRYASKRVEVQLQAAAGILQIAVDDDGPGVPEAQRERIFEPFSRLDETRSKSSGGYGLGLAIVRRIAECHGGRIDCVASPLGGARFQLQLPLAGQFHGTAANALGSS